MHRVIGFLFHAHLTHSLAAAPSRISVDVLFIPTRTYNVCFVGSVVQKRPEVKNMSVTDLFSQAAEHGGTTCQKPR